MDPVNRLALIVRPKRRYKEWADAVAEGAEDPVFDLDQARAVPSVYLVGDAQEPASLQDLIDRYAAEIFEDQLEGWHIDEAAWPPNRSPHVFRDWFDVALSDWVVDLDDDVPFRIDHELDGDGEIDELIEGLRGTPGFAIFCGWCRSDIEPDAEVLTVTLKGTRPPSQPTTHVIELEVAGRNVPAIVPGDDAPAAQTGVLALVMLCSPDCAQAFEDAWGRERGALTS